MGSCSMTIPMLDGDQITELRKRMDLSQAEMADLLGMADRFVVSKWERGARPPGNPTMRLLSLLDRLPAQDLSEIVTHLKKIAEEEARS